MMYNIFYCKVRNMQCFINLNIILHTTKGRSMYYFYYRLGHLLVAIILLLQYKDGNWGIYLLVVCAVSVC